MRGKGSLFAPFKPIMLCTQYIPYSYMGLLLLGVWFRFSTATEGAHIPTYVSRIRMAKHGVAPVEGEAPSVLRKILKWGNYESFGSPVLGTRFIPMKSPLTSTLQESLAQQVLRGSQSTPPPQHADTMATPCRRQTATPPSAGLLQQAIPRMRSLSKKMKQTATI